MDFCIHPITGRKAEIHANYPKAKQLGQKPDCLFCFHANTCEKRNGIFFVGEENTPCENHKDLMEYYKDTQKEQSDAKARIDAIKKIFTPTPRPAGSKKDCLHCSRLHRYNCRNLAGALFPKQGEGEICATQFYNEIIVRPEGEKKNCKYCITNHNCDAWKREHRGPCGEYQEYAPDNSGQKG